jgi:MerR family transcriptional regulator, thiopeptide resistance regulator
VAVFTVKQLAKLAGITPRTLHYYDEISLLKPSLVGDNGYRYYDEEAMLRLQQILLYRELDMPLEAIKQIMGRRDFNVLTALEKHKTELRQRITQLERLVNTVEHTIAHMKGSETMQKKQFFEGFSAEEQAEYEKEAMQMYDPETVKAANQRWQAYTPADKLRIAAESQAAYAALLAAMPQGPASAEARKAVELWRGTIEVFWTPDNEQLLGLAGGYVADPRFRANFDKIHPQLAEFLLAAVKAYLQH